MTQPDEITLTSEGKEGELLSYISDLKKEKQQAIDDVKLLRATLDFAYWQIDRHANSTDADEQEQILQQAYTCIDEALAATDRPEYREEG